MNKIADFTSKYIWRGVLFAYDYTGTCPYIHTYVFLFFFYGWFLGSADNPDMGTAEPGPAHFMLLAVSAFIGLIFVVFVVVLVVKELQEQKLRDAEDD